MRVIGISGSPRKDGNTGDFSSWLDISAHNSIHGCIKGQISCPINKEFQNNIAGPVEFNEKETLLLLEGKSIEEIPADIIFKKAKFSR